MGQIEIKSADEATKDHVLRSIAIGFAADPIARWNWPQASIYYEAMPRFAYGFGGESFGAGTAFYAGNYDCVSMWLPPGKNPNPDLIGPVFAETAPPEIGEDLEDFFGQLMAARPMNREHWYLTMICTDPAKRNQKLGEAIMRHVLDICDRDGVLAYLESSNPLNMPFYERLGFEVCGRVQAGSSPVFTPMKREPQK